MVTRVLLYQTLYMTKILPYNTWTDQRFGGSLVVNKLSFHDKWQSWLSQLTHDDKIESIMSCCVPQWIIFCNWKPTNLCDLILYHFIALHKCLVLYFVLKQFGVSCFENQRDHGVSCFKWNVESYFYHVSKWSLKIDLFVMLLFCYQSTGIIN